MATSLAVAPDSAQLEAPGETAQFTAEVRDQNGNVMTDVTVTWSSDAPAVATVDAMGRVTAVGAGTATVSAAAGALSASVTVTVEAAPPDEPPDDPPTASSPDRAALVALYESTGGENWVSRTHWLSDRPVAEWHGVYVDRDGRVVAIGLGDNGLAGAIPPEIGQLTALDELYLSYNDLAGGLPPELGNLTNLSALRLSENGLSGAIPRELGRLARLQSLDLDGNSLTGPIPPELGALANLEHLTLGRNDLSGAIPRELGNPARLQTLDLADNRLTGSIPPELGALSRLIYLFLWGNRLTGPIPPELGNLAELDRLHLTDNDLSGVIPPELTRLPLSRFWWSGNPGLCMPDTAAFAAWLDAMVQHVGGDHCNRSDRTALDALYQATGGSGWTDADGWPDGPLDSRHGVDTDAAGRVIAIDLSGNALDGELPLELGDLKVLKELRLGGNPDLSGRLPYTLPRLDALTVLRYAGTALCVPMEAFLREWLDDVAMHEGTGVDCAPTPDREVLESIYKAMGGEHWFDTGNWLTDAPLREWHGVDADGQGRVTRLDLTHNGLVGGIPPDIVALERLSELRLIGNDTQKKAIPPELGELANLTVLALAGIRASGPIPKQLGGLARLKVLYLADNELSGPIPPELGDLAALVELNLDNNRLAGPIPHELADASALEQIHLANNELSGALPTSLAGLENLWILDLSGNRLSDYLPAAFGEFERLDYLNLSYNDLFGAIPAELGGLASLRELYLGGNALSGPVPPELSGLSQLNSLALTGNAELAGPLPRSLAGLREMSHLQAIGTKLCAPPDAALRAWLDGLITRRVPPCGFEPEPAYLTQAIQSSELPIALVAGEEALLRVFPTAERANAERMPEVRASFYVGGTLEHSVDVPSGPGPIPTEFDESSLDRSVNVAVPAEIMQPGLEMVIEIDPDGTLDEDLGVVRRIPETGRLAVEVREIPRFDVTFVPFVWETNPDMSAVDLANAMAADPEGHEMLGLTRTLLPVGGIRVTAHAPVRTSTNAAHELLDQTRLIATMEGASGYYMGLLSGEFSGASGIADLGQPLSFSITDASVIAHEFGHNLSLQHAPCGNPLGVEPAYPYANASTGGWGYDFGEGRLVPPDEYVDLMSYCSPYWVSDF
ncbi:MAG: Ig-like domain-containing protein, partial [Acidobacteria bacterium]|nr:Ig-like domain-containing protein [Acidobacteriota bacterium]